MSRRLTEGAVLVLGTLAILVAAWRARRPAAVVESITPDRVAVAVFENGTGSAALDPLGTIAADWLTRGLARAPGIDVIDVGGLYVQGRGPEGAPVDPAGFARGNGAGVAVAGTFVRAGEVLTFSVEVIDAITGWPIGGLAPVTGSAGDPLQLVGAVLKQLEVELPVLLEASDTMGIASPPVAAPRYEAYEALVEARDLYWQGDWTGAIPLLRNAVRMDSASLQPLVDLGIAAAASGRCELADSVRQVVAGDSGVPAGDLLAVRAAAFRCSGERGEYERLLREQTALDPESARLRFLLAMSLRQSKRPAEAVDILLGIYPARDLGWLPEPARSVYWLELAANWHQLGEYDFELVTAARMTELAAPPLAVALVEARSLAGLGTPEAVLARGEGVLDSIRDIGILTGITRGLAPRDLVTPGWVNYVAAVELAAHGHTAQAGIVAAQATAWYRRLTEPTPTDRYVLARSLELTGEFGEALALARTLSREDAGNVDYRGLLGVLHARSGDMPAADTIDAWLSLRRDWFPPGLAQLHRARIAAVRGDAEGAIRLIESLPGGAHPYDVLEFHVDPAFASLRDDAAFQRFLRPRE